MEQRDRILADLAIASGLPVTGPELRILNTRTYTYRSIMRAKLIILLLSLVAVALAAFAIQTALRKRAERRRQAAYDAVLREYSTALQPGAQRREVEAMLTSRERSFRQMCCLLNENRNAIEDIVKIGSEPKPWYCSENNMYLVFEFDSMPDPRSLKAHSDDRLRRIALSPWLGGCL